IVQVLRCRSLREKISVRCSMRYAFGTIVALMLPAFNATAQDWPTRPIRALTTTSAGGISDVFMRALGEKLRERLGQPIVVVNRPGGALMVGARACQD